MEKTHSRPLPDQDKPVDGDSLLLTEQAQLESETKRTENLEGLAGQRDNTRQRALPLLHLVRQLLRNECSQTLARLAAGDDWFSLEAGPASPNLSLLLKFQRLLFIHLYKLQDERELLFAGIFSFLGKNFFNIIIFVSGDKEDEYGGALAILKKYIGFLSDHVVDVLTVATSVAETGSPRTYVAVARLMERDVVGVLLPEFILSLTFLHLNDRTFLLDYKVIFPIFQCVLLFCEMSPLTVILCLPGVGPQTLAVSPRRLQRPGSCRLQRGQ